MLTKKLQICTNDVCRSAHDMRLQPNAYIESVDVVNDTNGARAVYRHLKEGENGDTFSVTVRARRPYFSMTVGGQVSG